ncbi:MAG: FtsX-like permease family protein [Chloroflexota bacterium]|nr:FtsX-like permease family protein [Chloroflexota bacterium]
MLSLQIARRFLWRSKLQSVLIVLGMAVGIGTQVFVGSLITSLQASLLDSTVGSSAHVTLAPEEDGDQLVIQDRLATALEDPAITAVVPQHRAPVLARIGDQTSPLVLRLMEPEDRDAIYDLEARTVAGRADAGAGEIVVGVDFADEAGIDVGDELSLLTDAGDEVRATVAGIFDLGVAAVNAGTAFGTPDLAPDALELGTDEWGLIELQVADVFESDVLAAQLGEIPGIEVRDWQAENASLLSGLQSQGISSIMIQVFVVIAVGLGIASTLAIAAVQKTRQIGILKAMGLTDGASGAVFVWQGALLGVLGTAAGIGIGWALIEGFDAAASSSDALFPVSIDPSFAAVSAGVGIGIALLSAAIPYRRTSRLDPIEVIQNG